MNEAITGPAATPRARSREHLFTIMGAAALTLATLGLFLISRGKWSDAIIDSGREWIVPDALARGDLLYRDVVYWFGPFTPYFHAAFFKVLGSSFRTLVIAGIVGSLGVLAALFFALRTVTGRLEAALWTALAIPALVFMPNAGGSILGMGYRMWHAAAFGLVAVVLAVRPSLTASGSLAIGALAGAAGLCRTEWGLAIVLAAVSTRALSEGFRKNFAKQALLIVAAYVLVFFTVLAVFVAAAGVDAVLRDGHLLLTGLPRETRMFLVRFSGVADWREGIAHLGYSAAMWAGAYFLIEALTFWRRDPLWARRRLPWIAAVFVVLAGCAALGEATGAVLFSAAPLICLAAALFGLVRRPDTRAAALAGFGLLGLLLLYRRIFHIGDSAYVGPPLLFSFVAAAGLLRSAVLKTPVVLRARLGRGVVAALSVLTAYAFVGRAVQYRSDERVAISGTEDVLSARPQVAGRIAGLTSAIRQRTRPESSLVVFPEGELLNYLSGRRNPLRHKLYIPGYLNDENETLVLAELERYRPDSIVVWDRPTGEYGPISFGNDYGRGIWSWIKERYALSFAELRPFDRMDLVGPRSRVVLGIRER